MLGRLLYRLPLCQLLIITVVVVAGFASWTLLFYQRKKSVSFVRSSHIVANIPRHSTELWSATDKLITCQLFGRFGNMMFAYASLVGIALKNGRTPALPENHFLRTLFRVRAAPLPHTLSGGMKLKESRAGAYDRRFEHLQSDAALLELVGYFQSWKYFADIEHEIRAEFTFQRHLTVAADAFLQRTIDDNFGRNVRRRDVLLIGVHVRVGDMALDINLARGYTVATPDYFTVAMEWFQHRFPRSKLLYIVATDDMHWCQDNFPYKSSGKSAIVHTELGPDVEDLAVLTRCNHTIVSVGSFGWWAAWLTNGITVYYHDFPRLNSSLAQEYVLNDYYPDNWIAM